MHLHRVDRRQRKMCIRDRDEIHTVKRALNEAQDTIIQLKSDSAREIVKCVIEINRLNTKLEEIPTELGLTFGMWIKEKTKKANTNTSTRNNYTINHTIAAVKKMYRDIAKHKKYITENEMPMFKYLKVNRETRSRKDVITAEEFTAITKWMNYMYCNEKGINKREYYKRRVYALVYTIHHYTGCRTKELLNLKWRHITINPNDNAFDRKTNRIVHIPADNSKTGRSRDIIAPIGPVSYTHLTLPTIYSV